MSSPKIICKSGYITSAQHVHNILDYAGNKIETQTILYKDGSFLDVDNETRIVLTPAQKQDISGIRLAYKDGGSKVITCDAYEKLTQEHRSAVTVEELELVEDDEVLISENGKPYHKTEDLNFFSYLNYIEGRPGVEKADGHGVFGLTGDISIADAQKTALDYKDSRKWSHIVSLTTEGAARTDFNRRDMWAALIRSKAPMIAKTYNISLQNLVINCAYHGNTDNPHVHLLFYSKDDREGFVKGGKEGMQQASDKLKSTLFNSIFKNDVEPLKYEKTQLRDAMQQRIQQHLQNVLTKDFSHSEVAEKLLHLSADMQELTGKRVYGFLPPAIKTQVNDILRQIITGDADMQQLYTEYLNVQRDFVAQYVLDPDKIKASVEDFDRHFFEPDKTDLKLYHNAIVKAAAALGDGLSTDGPPANDRAAKDKITDATTPELPLSTEETDFPMFMDEDVPFPSDDEGFPNVPIEERATKEKILDATTTQPPVSTISSDKNKRPSFKEMAALLEKKEGCLNKDSFRTIYRSALGNIFNPKHKNSENEELVLAEMRKLHSIDREGKYSEEAKEHIRTIFRTLYQGAEIQESVAQMFDNSRALLTKEYGEESCNAYLASFDRNMHSVKYTNAAHNYLYYFAEKLYDQQYYQLLAAFREFNTPLNNAMFKEIREISDTDYRKELMEAARKIKGLHPYMDDNEARKAVSEMVRPVFYKLLEQPQIKEVYGEYLANYDEVLDTYMEGRAEKYQARMRGTLMGVQQLMRPHLNVVQFAKNHEDFVYRRVTHDKEITKAVNKHLYQRLCHILTDTDTFSSSLIRQELERYGVADNKEHLQKILKYLYDTDKKTRQLVDDSTEAVYVRLKQELGTEVAGKWIATYKKDLFSYESSLSYTFTIHRFAENLPQNYYNQILKAEKEILNPVYRCVFEALNAFAETPALLKQLEDLRKALLSDEPDKDLCKNLTVALAHSLEVPELSKIAEEITNAMSTAISKYDIGSNVSAEILGRLEDELYHKELSGILFMAQNFAQELDIHQAKWVFAQIKPQLKEYRSSLFRELRRQIVSKNETVLSKLSDLKNNPNNPEKLDCCLTAISTPECDFMQNKTFLFHQFREKMQQKSFDCSQAEYAKLFDRFFYATTDNPYDTLFVKETMIGAYEKAEEIQADHERYKLQSATRTTVNGLFNGFAALLCNQIRTTQQNTKKEDTPKANRHKRKLRNKRHNIAQEQEAVSY